MFDSDNVENQLDPCAEHTEPVALSGLTFPFQLNRNHLLVGFAALRITLAIVRQANARAVAGQMGSGIQD